MTEQQVEQVEIAERVVAELKEKAAALVERQQQIAEERKRLSFAAHTGDAKAKAALDKLNSEAQRHALDMENLAAAIEEANARLAIAQAAQVQQGGRDNALAIRAGLAEFNEAAFSLDEALTAIGEEAVALFAAVRKLHALGCAVPSDAQVRVLGLQCLQTALMQTGPWSKEFIHLAPRDRRSWASLARTWSAQITANHIAPVLGEAESADAAA
jgi:hypothetical protein